MHYLNKPAKVRDVLEARNYVARTVINCANYFLSMIYAFAMFWLYGKCTEIVSGHGFLWAIVFIGAYYELWIHIKIKPSTDLVKSEETCNETPYEGDSIIDF